MVVTNPTKDNIIIDYTSKDYCNIVTIKVHIYTSLRNEKVSHELCKLLNADLYQLKEDMLSIYIDKEKRKERYQEILTQKQNFKKAKDKERKTITQRIEKQTHKIQNFLEFRLQESQQLGNQMQEISEQKEAKQQNQKEFEQTGDNSKITFNFEIEELKTKEKELSQKYEKAKQKIQEYQNLLSFLQNITNPKQRNYLNLEFNRKVKKKLDNSYLLAKTFIEEKIQEALTNLLSLPKATKPSTPHEQ